jgi:anaphase-promoting complex subunit 1
MRRSSRYFNLRLEDLRYVADFYGKVYDRRFSGRSESNPRPPLIRENTALGALHSLNEQLDLVRADPEFLRVFKAYVRGQPGALLGGGSEVSARNGEGLGMVSPAERCPAVGSADAVEGPGEESARTMFGCTGARRVRQDAETLDEGIREVLHVTAASVAGKSGPRMDCTRSLNEVLRLWS